MRKRVIRLLTMIIVACFIFPVFAGEKLNASASNVASAIAQNGTEIGYGKYVISSGGCEIVYDSYYNCITFSYTSQSSTTRMVSFQVSVSSGSIVSQTVTYQVKQDSSINYTGRAGFSFSYSRETLSFAESNPTVVYNGYSYVYRDSLYQDEANNALRSLMSNADTLLSNRIGYGLGDVGFSHYTTYGSSSSYSGNSDYYPSSNYSYDNNDTRNTAVQLEFGKTYRGEIGSYGYYCEYGEDTDYYKINFIEGHTYKITIGGVNEQFGRTSLLIRLIDPDNYYRDVKKAMLSDGVDSYNYEATHTGTYYIKLFDYHYNPNTDNSEPSGYNYTIKVIDKSSSTPTPTLTPASTVTPTPTPIQVPTSTEPGVSGFVERLYTVALGRASDPAGKADWVNRVTNGGQTGADLAMGFLFSDEFMSKNMSNSQFLDVLYVTFFNRTADQGGKNNWLNAMAAGMSKQDVIRGFINSTEWANLCLTYGIASGGTGTPNITIQPSQSIIDFATRLYTTCLGRNADSKGLNDWATQLANRQISGSAAAHGFFFSEEFTIQNFSNDEYVTRLYRTFMGREPDPAGFADWTGRLANGASREDVFQGFVGSAEWAEICSNYGILK